MRKMANVERVEKVIETLSPAEQLRLMEKLVHTLRRSSMKPGKGLDWSLLYGSGRGLWTGEDAQCYVDRLREDRL